MMRSTHGPELRSLVAQVERMVQESGVPEGFDASAWLHRWLDELCPALGGRRPGDLLDTTEGRSQVSDLLARMQSGAFG